MRASELCEAFGMIADGAEKVGDLVNARPGATPLQFLEVVYRNENIPLSVRIKCAIEALPFVFIPSLQSQLALMVRALLQQEAAAARSRAVMQASQPRVIEYQPDP